MKKSSSILLTAFCFVSIMSINVQAQENIPAFAQDDISPMAQDEVYNAGQVVVTGTRTEAFIEDVPASIEVVTKEDIAIMGATTVKEALRQATNVRFVSGDGVRLRGMSGSHTLVLVNGRKTAGEIRSDTAAGNALNRISINSVERIEILRGPASALYGSDAMGGVINIITKKSTEQQFMAGASVGTKDLNNYYQFDTGTIGKWNAIVDARFTQLFAQTSKYDNDSKTAAGPQGYINADIGFAINEDHNLNLYLEYFIEDVDRENIDNAGITDYQNTVNRRFATALSYSGSTENHDFSLTGSFSRLNEWEEDEDDAGGTNNTSSNWTQWGFEAQDSWAINDMNLVTFGGEFKRYDANAPDAFTGTPASTTDYFAFYLQDEIALFDDTLIIIPAIRYDNYDSFGGKFSPKIGVTWEFIENHRLKASYGLGFRAPTVEDLYRNTEWNSTTDYVGNPDLKPEESAGYEIGYEGAYKNVFGSAMYFNNDITNLIDDRFSTTDAAGNDIITFRNIGKATIRGVELELGVNFMEYFTIKGQYNYIDGKNTETNERLLNIAQDTFIAHLMYNDPSANGFSANLWAEFVRNLITVNDVSIDYETVNFSIRKKWKDDYSIFASVENIFDTQNSINNDFIDPRTFTVGFEVRF